MGSKINSSSIAIKISSSQLTWNLWLEMSRGSRGNERIKKNHTIALRNLVRTLVNAQAYD